MYLFGTLKPFVSEMIGHRYELRPTYVTFRKHLSKHWHISNQGRTARIYKVEGSLCKVGGRNSYDFNVRMCGVHVDL
jgi:hypothetical protein